MVMVQHSLYFFIPANWVAADDGNWFDAKAATWLYIPILLNWFIKKCKQSRAFVVFVLMSSVIRFSIPKFLQTCLDPYLWVTTRTEILINVHLPLLLAPSTGKALISPIQAPVKEGIVSHEVKIKDFQAFSSWLHKEGACFYFHAVCLEYPKLPHIQQVTSISCHLLLEGSYGFRGINHAHASWFLGSRCDLILEEFFHSWTPDRDGIFLVKPAFPQKYRHTPRKFNSPHMKKIVFQPSFSGGMSNFGVSNLFLVSRLIKGYADKNHWLIWYEHYQVTAPHFLVG